MTTMPRVSPVDELADEINALHGRLSMLERIAHRHLHPVLVGDAGTVTATFSAGTTASMTVTFAAGRFAVAPRLVCQCRSNAAAALGMTFRTTAITETSATVVAALDSSTTGSFSVDWIAVAEP